MSFFRKRQPSALVLGCGPAGMFATHALAEAGWKVEVWSKKRPSHLYGAQFLHEPIPGLPEVRRFIRYQLIGTADDYARKVYGSLAQSAEAVAPASPRSFATGPQQFLPVWDIRAAYYAAYEKYSHLIQDIPDISGEFLAGEFGAQAGRPLVDLAFSTIPAKSLCWGGHNFESAKVWAIGDAPELGQIVPIPCPPDSVICSGDPHEGWYRKSRIFDHVTVEWPGDRRPPISGVVEVTKPIRTDCNCWDFVTRLGRYGKWQKGILSHHAYSGTLSRIRSFRHAQAFRTPR